MAKQAGRPPYDPRTRAEQAIFVRHFPHLKPARSADPAFYRALPPAALPANFSRRLLATMVKNPETFAVVIRHVLSMPEVAHA
jgi:hypothetical protein